MPTELCASSRLQHWSSRHALLRHVKLGVRDGAWSWRVPIQSMTDWGVTGLPAAWCAVKDAPTAILVLAAEVRRCRAMLFFDGTSYWWLSHASNEIPRVNNLQVIVASLRFPSIRSVTPVVCDPARAVGGIVSSYSDAPGVCAGLPGSDT